MKKSMSAKTLFLPTSILAAKALPVAKALFLPTPVVVPEISTVPFSSQLRTLMVKREGFKVEG